MVISSEIDLSEEDALWLKDLNQLIKSQLLEGNCSVDELTTHLYFSRTRFFNKVKNLTGTTPAAYIREIRLDLAYEMVLESPSQSFSSISNSLGMSDPKHFKKLFINKFGVDPKALNNF